MTDDRPYRKALSEIQAREELIEGAAVEFDPDVVTVLLSLQGLDELRSYANRDESSPTESTPTDIKLFSSYTG
jgi:HD-GYP domain-containing protein (c-di-GMP phosphodiesterase class II)